MNWMELKNTLAQGETRGVKIGDEFSIELKTGEQVTLVCELVKDGHATFFTKDLLEDTHVMGEDLFTCGKKQLSTMDGYLEKLFCLLPEDLQAVICDKKLRLLREREVFGRNIYGKVEDCEQLPRYQSVANRVKRLGGAPFSYWLASPFSSYGDAFCIVASDGAPSNDSAYITYGVCFGFEI